MRGGESDVFHEEDGIRLAQRLPDGKFVTVPRAGHTVQGDNPKDLVAELRRFARYEKLSVKRAEYRRRASS